jgi:hypothetical protein
MLCVTPGEGEDPMIHGPWRIVRLASAGVVLMVLGAVLFNLSAVANPGRGPAGKAAPRTTRVDRLFARGRHIFRNDTFGDQAFWGGQLRLHKAIEGAKLGGVGPGLSPKAALAAGLKVDASALPATLVRAIRKGKVDLNSPKTTLALLKLNAVVGVKGFFNKEGSLTTVGLTCAVCHSTVDNSFAPGIGQRLDGWPNRDLNVGAVISLAPNLTPVSHALNNTPIPTIKKVLASWGPGKFDAELFLDGKAFQPNGTSGATLIPPAFGLSGVNLATWTGWGSITYWNAFVANIEMHGQGDFTDARLDNAQQFPLGAANGYGHIRHRVDKVTSALGALQDYELDLQVPKPRKGSFNRGAAARGRMLFDGKATCSSCHTPSTYSTPGQNLVNPQQVCEDSFEADRSPTHMYRISPLNGLYTHVKRGFYHDGRFRTLRDVVKHYDSCFGLHLSNRQQGDIVQYLKSL